MKTSQIAELAASLASGSISTDTIAEEFGSDILSQVLAVSSGSLVADLTVGTMRATGVSELIDDVADGVGGFFDDIFS